MRARPTGVLVVSIVYALAGASLIALAVYGLMASVDVSRVPSTNAIAGVDLAKYVLFLALLGVVIGAALAAIAWGLWQLRQWAQASAIAVAALSLLGDAFSVLVVSSSGSNASAQVYLWIGLSAVVWGSALVYLLLPSTAAHFGAGETLPVNLTCLYCDWPGVTPEMLSCPRCGRDPRGIAPAGVPTPLEPEPRMDSMPTRSGAGESGMRAWLVVRSGPDTGRRWDLVDDVHIGRDGDSAISLHDDYVSRQHARVKLESGQFFIYDVGSRTGTFVNGRAVQRLMLYDGSQIRVGSTTLEFKRTSVGR